MSSGALPDIWWSNLHLPMLWQMAMKWFDWLKLLDTFCQGVLLEGVPWVRTRLHHLMGMHSLSLERLKLDYRSIGFPRSTPLKSKPEQPSPPCSSSSASRWSLVSQREDIWICQRHNLEANLLQLRFRRKILQTVEICRLLFRHINVTKQQKRCQGVRRVQEPALRHLCFSS